MNIVHLLGRLVFDPELKNTPNDSVYCRFRLAVPKSKGQSDFFNIVAWDKTAEFVVNYFSKGERIIVHGAVHNSDYTDKNGNKQYTVEVTAERLEFADTKSSKNSETEPAAEVPAPTEADEPAEAVSDYPI